MKTKTKLLAIFLICLAVAILFSYEVFLKTRFENSNFLEIVITFLTFFCLFYGMDKLAGRADKNFYQKISKRGEKSRKQRGTIYIVLGVCLLGLNEFYLKSTLEISHVSRMLLFLFGFYPLIYGIMHFKTETCEKTSTFYQKKKK